MPAAIEGLNYVESNINNDIIQVETPSNTANATLVVGTTRKGKKNTLFKIDITSAATIFGAIPTEEDFDTNLVHAANAIQASTGTRDKEMYGIAVGDSSPAVLSLYENQVFVTGDTSFSLDDQGEPIVSMEFQSLEETETANANRVEIRQDNSGLPTAMIITLESGYTRVFGMDPYGVRVNVARDVAELTANIRADATIAAVMNVRFNALQKSNLQVAVQSGAVPFIEVGPTAPTANASWGDKLIGIDKLLEYLTYTQTLVAGAISQKLTFKPIKDTNPDLTARAVTIQSFKKVVKDELIKAAQPIDLGTTSLSKALAIASPALAWDHVPGNITNVAIILNHGGNLQDITSSSSYVIDTSGVITLNCPALTPGDRVTISYKFGAGLTEAFVRSDLVQGDDNSYFIAGSDIIFGSAPSLPVEPTYAAIKEFQLGDYSVVDRENIRIEFVNPAKAPTPGVSDVRVTFRYLPELPAPTAAVIQGTSNTYIQESALKGGTSGSKVDKQRYRELVATALDLTLITPFRKVMVAGSYLDDIVDGIDPETGLDGQINVNWPELLAAKLLLKSRVAAECNTVLGVRPISTDRLARGEVGINEWTTELLSTADVINTPSALMAALNSYHIDVALGVPFCADITILGGNGYIENPAYVVCGMQLDNPLTQSLIRAPMAPIVKRLLVTFPSGFIQGRLNSARYTALIVNSKGEMRISDAPTGADPRTPMARQIVRDTTFATLKMARDIAENYIGLRRTATTLNMAKDKINRDIGRALVPDFLTFFNCELVPVQGGHITGETKMRVAIETAVEVRRFIFETTVKLGGEGL